MRRNCLCRVLALSLPSLFAAADTRPPDRKAVVIGINCYDPYDQARPDCTGLRDLTPGTSGGRPGISTGDWRYWKYRNLHGAVNDAKMMAAILKAQGFTIPEDALLLDTRATASGILKTLRKYLLDDTAGARPGDVRFVYYSGHGNYVRNMAVRSPSDPERYDETIVPADHWLGTPDIRDKELSRIFSQASKRVRIVFLSDSCHSGSIARGPGGMVKTALSGSADAPEAPKVTDRAPPDDSRRNGLILISAARRDQPALETDAAAEPGAAEAGTHGAFTWALRRALIGQAEAPLSRVFQRAAALLALDKPNQVPNLDGLRADELNLFGSPARDRQTQTVAVEEVKGDEVRLRGGRAIGIYEGTELQSAAGGRPPVMLRVTREESLDGSRAAILDLGGNAAVRPGDLFQVDKWVIPSDTMLRVAIPPAISGEALRSAMVEFGKLPAELGARWVDDETGVPPTHYLRWNGTSWLLESGDLEEGGTDVGRTPAAGAVVAKLPAGATLFVAIPPTANLVAALPFGTPEDRRIAVLNSGSADYRLRGRLHEGRIEYAWIRPAAARIQSRAGAGTFSLPFRTDWIPAETDSPRELAGVLADKAHRLGKLREWQSLPAVGSGTVFPYRLEVRDAKTRKVVTRTTGGQKLKLFLKADPPALKAAGPIVPRYTYIFVIDPYGKSSLVWPRPGMGNQDNLFPPPVAEGEKQAPRPLEIAVSGNEAFDLEVDEPYGSDAYMLLTSVQRLDNPDLLNFDGVRPREVKSSRGAGGNPLEDLLANVGTLSRGAIVRVPTDWKLDVTIVRSDPPAR